MKQTAYSHMRRRIAGLLAVIVGLTQLGSQFIYAQEPQDEQLLNSGASVISPALLAKSPYTVNKSETIYAHLTNEGTVQSLSAANWFVLEESGFLVDPGCYLSLTALSENGSLSAEETHVEAAVVPGEFGYEGELTPEMPLPWAIDVSHTLDGEEVTAQALAGADGAWVMQLGITPNPAYVGDLEDSFTLKVCVTLDANTCERIFCDADTEIKRSEDTIQLYYILPGAEACTVKISAQVHDFSMQSIEIEAIPRQVEAIAAEAIPPETVERPDAAALELSERLDALSEYEMRELPLQELGQLWLPNLDMSEDAAFLSQSAIDLQEDSLHLTEDLTDLAAGAQALQQATQDTSNLADGLQTDADTLAQQVAEVGAGVAAVRVGADGLAASATALGSGLGQAQLDAATLQLATTESGTRAQSTAQAADDLQIDAKALSEDAATLYAGLDAVSRNNTNLQSGMDAMLQQLFDMASTQLNAYCEVLLDYGVVLEVALTPDNYAAELDRAKSELAAAGLDTAVVDVLRDQLSRAVDENRLCATYLDGVTQLTADAQTLTTAADELNTQAEDLFSATKVATDDWASAGSTAAALVKDVTDANQHAAEISVGTQTVAAAASTAGTQASGTVLNAGVVATTAAGIVSATNELDEGADDVRTGAENISAGGLMLADEHGTLAENMDIWQSNWAQKQTDLETAWDGMAAAQDEVLMAQEEMQLAKEEVDNFYLDTAELAHSLQQYWEQQAVPKAQPPAVQPEAHPLHSFVEPGNPMTVALHFYISLPGIGTGEQDAEPARVNRVEGPASDAASQSPALVEEERTKPTLDDSVLSWILYWAGY